MDYKKIIERIIENGSFAGSDGIKETVKILDYLEAVPFIDAVADELGIPLQTLYDRLRYYLRKEEFDELLQDIKERKRERINNFKKNEVKKSERRYTDYYS